MVNHWKRSSSRDTGSALVEAGRDRFRAIAMTGFATILTLAPLALAIGEDLAMQQPLAVDNIAGLLARKPLVLLVMPSLHAMLGATPLRAGTVAAPKGSGLIAP